MSNGENEVILHKSTSLFFWSFGLLMVEVIGIIGLMILAKPLSKILPVYFLLSVVLVLVSMLLIHYGKKSSNIRTQILIANLAGMIWWTLAEIGRDVFLGANIENQGGIFLLMVVLAAFYSISSEISFTNATAILTFIANWLGHIILELIMHFRNPDNPTVVPDPHAFWNVFGFGYGVFSAVAAVVLILAIFIRKPDKKAAMIYALVEYVMVLNVIYVFAKGLFAL